MFAMQINFFVFSYYVEIVLGWRSALTVVKFVGCRPSVGRWS